MTFQGIHPLLPPQQKAEVPEAQRNLHQGGSRGRQPDVEQRRARPPAHEPGDWGPDAEGPGDALEHDEGGLPAAVEVPDKAEQEAGQQAVDGVGAQMVRRRQDDVGLPGEDSRQQVPMEELEVGHGCADQK